MGVKRNGYCPGGTSWRLRRSQPSSAPAEAEETFHLHYELSAEFKLDALRRYVSDEAAKSALAPNEFSDSEVIKALLAEAGFQAIRREILRFDRNIGPAQESIPKEMAGSPYWDAVMKLDRAAKDALVNDVGEALLEFQNISGFAIPQETHMIRAMKR